MKRRTTFIGLLVVLVLIGYLGYLWSSPTQAQTLNQRPTSDDSNTGNFTIAPLWSKVNDSNDNTYITGVTNNGGRATFTFTPFAIPAGATNISVSTSFRHRDAASGTNKAGASLKVGTTYYDNNGLVEPTTTWTTSTYTWWTNPAGGVWTSDVVNTLTVFGVSSNDFNPDVRFSEVWIEVNYSDPPSYYNYSDAQILQGRTVIDSHRATLHGLTLSPDAHTPYIEQMESALRGIGFSNGDGINTFGVWDEFNTASELMNLRELGYSSFASYENALEGEVAQQGIEDELDAKWH